LLNKPIPLVQAPFDQATVLSAIQGFHTGRTEIEPDVRLDLEKAAPALE